MAAVPSKRVPQLVKYTAAIPKKVEHIQPVRPQPNRTKPPVTSVAETRRPQTPPQQLKKQPQGGSGGKLKTMGLVVAILAAGAAAGVLVVGELLVAVYAVYAFVRRLKSRTTFMLVLVSLATIMVLHATGRDAALASNFAVYSLLLAFIGIISLAREVRMSVR